MNSSGDFQQLLRECGVQGEYEDVNKKVQRASTESLLVLLRALGVDIERPEQAVEALRRRRQTRFEQGMEPVFVAWDGLLPEIAVTLPLGAAGSIQYEITAEDDRQRGEFRLEQLSQSGPAGAAALGYVCYRLPISSGRLPMGYCQLRLEAGGRHFESLIISSPTRAYRSTPGELPASERAWGGFLPLYAARRRDDWGVGDFTALGRLTEWTGKLGGGAFGTLPLLATSLDEPFEPSPYRPVSRLFWNELFVDVMAIPELADCGAAREIVEGSNFRECLVEISATKLVDYRAAMKAKRRVLSALAQHFFETKPARFADYRRFAEERPRLESYARFRAVVDRQRADWMQWPERLRETIAEGDFDVADMQYHLYAQWIAEEQLQEVKRRAEAAECGLYLDLPIGVDPGGYDAWSNKEIFVPGVTIGAPPDPFFTRGQDWGLPPIHPERLREPGYATLREVLATSMKYARYLRVDHAMGWHRLYWIASGLPADRGAYVRYPADELYAVASLESHRHRCTLLAEDLGTTPPELESRMERHGIGGMWVAPFELEPSRRQDLRAPSPLSVASLNTHDMPTLASWWVGHDIADRQDLGLLSEAEAEAERTDRQAAVALLREFVRRSGALPLGETGEDPPLAALLRYLGASTAQLVLVNLEDLWLETEPQNVPGTSSERPNWRRRARYTIEEFTHMPEVVEALSLLSALRRRAN